MRKRNEHTVQSPCVDNCCLNDDDICMGCFRTLQEILDWGEADFTKIREILLQVEVRRRGG